MQDVVQYFKLPLGECQFSENMLAIKIKIPIKKLRNEWKVYRYTPIPFRCKDKVCKVHTGNLLLAHEKNGDEIYLLNKEKCNIEKEMCYVDRFDSESEGEQGDCLEAIFLGQTR